VKLKVFNEVNSHSAKESGYYFRKNSSRMNIKYSNIIQGG